MIKVINLFLIFSFTQIFATENMVNSFQNFHNTRMNINQTAMIILGSWAAGNILIGTYGNFKESGEAKYFHQFNAMW